MGEPLPAAARLLSELPPLLELLRSVRDADLEEAPAGRGRTAGAPARGATGAAGALGALGAREAFWRAAADRTLRELRGEPAARPALGDPAAAAPETAASSTEAKQAQLRLLLRRAKAARRLRQRHYTAGVRRGRLPAARGLPHGAVEALPGLFLADLPEGDGVGAAEAAVLGAEGDGAAPATHGGLLCELGVEDVVVLDGDACDMRPADLWDLFRLFEDRLILLFDRGRRVLLRGRPSLLACALYGLLLRQWRLPADEAAELMERLGRAAAAVPAAFRDLVGHPREDELPAFAGGASSQPPLAVLALRAHAAAAVGEGPKLQQAREALAPATGALLGQAMRWEPAVHDGLSPGLASLAALRAVRAELGALRNQELAVSLAKLCCVTWRSGGEVLLEEGLVLELEGEGEPARLEDELRLELQDAAELPELLLVALEGPRPVLIGETVTVGAACQTYDTFALAWPGGMANRGGAAAPVSSPPEGATAGPGGALLVPRPPLVAALVRRGVRPPAGWAPWAGLVDACSRAPDLPPVPRERVLQVRVVTLAQFQGALRSGRRLAWEGLDALGAFEIPVDARASQLQRRLQANLQVPPARQLLLSPGSGGWRLLLPSARIADHVYSPGSGSGGACYLATSVVKENPASWGAVGEQDPAAFLSFPWVPAVCSAWVERQLVPLEVVLFDARRTLASYAAKVARRVEEEVGPRGYCTAFAAWEMPPPLGPAGSWRPLQMGAPLAAELSAALPEEGVDVVPARAMAWEALPLAPSMTGRALFAAQESACLPAFSSRPRKPPLERLFTQQASANSAVAGLLAGAGLVLPTPSAPPSEPEDYAALVALEERLLLAWVEGSAEAVETISMESRRRMDAAVARLRTAAPREAPPGLREWPPGQATSWSGRAWEKVSRAAGMAPGWTSPSPASTEEEVARSLMWAEVSTLQDILLCLDAIRLCRGRATLGEALGGRVPQLMHLCATVERAAQAESGGLASLVRGGGLDGLFEDEVDDLPVEADFDLAQVHALAQTTCAEANALWAGQREALQAGEEALLWRAVRLRELALCSPFLLLKHAQATRLSEGEALEWLRQVQRACLAALQKSQVLCAVASCALVPAEGSEGAVAAALQDLNRQLREASASLQELRQGPGQEAEGPGGAGEGAAPPAEEVEQLLGACDLHALRGNLTLHALERQLECSVAAPSQHLAGVVEELREGLYRLTPQSLLVRSHFDLPLADDSASAFAAESYRRGRKLRLPAGRQGRRGAWPQLAAHAADPEAPEDEAAAAEAARLAEERGAALLRLEEQAAAQATSRGAKRKKQRKAKGSVVASPEGAVSGPPLAEPPAKLGGPGGVEHIEAKDGCVDGPAANRADEKPGGDAARRSRGGTAAPRVAEPEEEADPDGAKETEELVLLGKAPFELLGERRKARLLEVQAASGARCTLEPGAQGVRLAGTAGATAAARQLLQDLRVEWVEVAAPAWTVLLKGRNCAGGHLSRLEAESHSQIVVDRNEPRVRVAGTASQVEEAQAWLLRLREECSSTQVWLGNLAQPPERLVARAEAGKVGVRVQIVSRGQGCGSQALVQGLSGEVQRAAQFLREATAAGRPTGEAPAPPVEPAPASPTVAAGEGRRVQDAPAAELAAAPADSAAASALARTAGRPAAGRDPASPAAAAARGRGAALAEKAGRGPEEAVGREAVHDWKGDAKKEPRRAEPRKKPPPLEEERPARDGVRDRERPRGLAAAVAHEPAAAGGAGGPRALGAGGTTMRPTAPVFQPRGQHTSPWTACAEAKEDVLPMTLAERLALQFPSARIIVGAPEQARPSAPPEDNTMEARMLRLKALLDEDKLEKRSL